MYKIPHPNCFLGHKERNEYLWLTVRAPVLLLLIARAALCSSPSWRLWSPQRASVITGHSPPRALVPRPLYSDLYPTPAGQPVRSFDASGACRGSLARSAGKCNQLVGGRVSGKALRSASSSRLPNISVHMTPVGKCQGRSHSERGRVRGPGRASDASSAGAITSTCKRVLIN